MRVNKALRFFKIKSENTLIAKHLVNDSREMKEDAIFIAIDKGVEYLKELKIKPLVILSNVKVVGAYFIPNLKEQLGEFAKYFYYLKKNKPKIIGVMGTNGKTTVANILHELLPSSMLVTTLSDVKDSFFDINTTPDAIRLANYLKKTRELKKKYLILEISSIGIAENRVKGFEISYILFLNLSKDHLDYHKTLKNYQDTKINYIKNSNALIVANAKDKFGLDLIKNNKAIPFKFSKDLIIKKDLEKTIFLFDNKEITTNLLGEINAINVIAALTLLKVMKIKIDIKKLEKCKRVRGRMDVIHNNPNIVIDYAHTSLAFLSVLKEIKSLTNGRLIVVFGAGGNRDKSKRKEYGDYALTYADKIILTDDNPREENELGIIKDIISEKNEKVEIIINRKEAIKKGIESLNKEDTLLIVGKGHEEYQIIGKKYYKYSDYDEVRKWL